MPYRGRLPEVAPLVAPSGELERLAEELGVTPTDLRAALLAAVEAERRRR